MMKLSSRLPGLSRAKALIGTLMVTAALAGTVQAAVPVSASAMRDQHAEWCSQLLASAHQYEWFGAYTIAQRLYTLGEEENCWPRED